MSGFRMVSPPSGDRAFIPLSIASTPIGPFGVGEEGTPYPPIHITDKQKGAYYEIPVLPASSGSYQDQEIQQNPVFTEENRYDDIIRSDMRSYADWKYDLFQVLGTALAVAAVVVPLLQWGIDSKMEALTAKLEASEEKQSAIQNSILTEVRATNTRMDDMYRYIDAKTEKKQ